MKRMLLGSLVVVLSGCINMPVEKTEHEMGTASVCEGDTSLPLNLVSKFEPAEDPGLLNKTIGEPGKGKLCQGKVYVSKKDAQIKVFRAWNSTNPNSQLGEWWAFKEPNGKVATYRSDYEICYQWSPLDKLVSCTLSPGTKVVVGTGQSAKCSDYLTYSTSDKQQIYIQDGSNSLSNCTVYDGVFQWE